MISPNRATSQEANQRPIKVAYLIDDLSARAGNEIQLAKAIETINRQRVTPHLILLAGKRKDAFDLEALNCDVLRLNVRSLMSLHAVREASRLRRYLQNRQMEVLQLHFPDSTYFGCLAARLAGLRGIIRTRRNVGHWMTPVHKRLGRAVSKMVSCTVANCQAAAKAVIEQEGADPSSVVVIRNGIDTARFDSIPPIDGPINRIGVLANLRGVKNLDLLIRAMQLVVRQFPECTCRIAGEGPEKANLQHLIDSLGLAEHVTLIGSVSQPAAFLGEIQLAVLCSKAEGLSNAVLEYMAAGRVVVATQVGGNAELIDHGTSGLLVPAQDVNALANALLQALSNPSASQQMARSAWKKVRQGFSVQAEHDAYCDLYESLARSTGIQRVRDFGRASQAAMEMAS